MENYRSDDNSDFEKPNRIQIINRRIKSVRSTKKITRAMELIASSRIVKAQNRMKSSESYFGLLSEIVQDLINNGAVPKVDSEEVKDKVLLIVLTSDRGLAGAYNTNVLKIADNRRIEIEKSGRDVEIVTVGKNSLTASLFSSLEARIFALSALSLELFK